MKLCFSTLSCPDWELNDIFSAASDLGYTGIEIRGIANEIYAPHAPELSPERAPALLAKLSSAGIKIPLITSGAYVIGNSNPDSCISETRDYILLASRLGTKYVRLMGEKYPNPHEASPDLDGAAAVFAEMCDFASQHDVSILCETNGCFADTALLAGFIKKVDRENLGVIWDIHHPYRYFGESPEKTWNNIGGSVRHIHVKDSLINPDGTIKYMLTGYGDIPVSQCVRILRDANFGGYVSYEWVKRWSRELAEPGISLYQYIEYMKTLEKQL